MQEQLMEIFVEDIGHLGNKYEIYKTNEQQKQDHTCMQNLHKCYVTSIRHQQIKISQ